MINNVTLVGRMVKDPELKYIPGTETAVATFTIAIDRNYKNKDGSTTTDFIPIEVIGKSAEFCANYLSKGRLVGVQGSIKVDRYETQDGEKRSFTKVNSMNIRALDKKGDGTTGSGVVPESSDGTEFSAIEDDDVPF